MDRSNDPRDNFDASPTLGDLIAQQGKGPIADPKVLMGDFWPEDEPSSDSWLRSTSGEGTTGLTVLHEYLF